MSNMSKFSKTKKARCYLGRKMLTVIINGSVALFGLLVLGSCNGVEVNHELLDDVALINANSPISAGKIGTINRAEIEDSCIILHYYLTEEFKQIAWNDPKLVFDERLQYVEIALLDTTNIQEEPLTKIYFDAFKNGYSIRNQYHFQFDNGIDADIAKTILKPDVFYSKYQRGDIKQICTEALKIRAANENRLYKSLNLPDSLKSFDIIEDSMFVIGACVPSKDYVNVWFSQWNLRKNLLKSFQDPSMKTFAQQCFVCEKGICFRYVSLVKKDSFDVKFSPSQLENLVSNYDEVINEYKRIDAIGNPNN